MKKVSFFTTCISSLMFLACQNNEIDSPSDGKSSEMNSSIQIEEVGTMHNECMEAAYDAINLSPLLNTRASNTITVEDFTSILGQTDAASYRRIGELKKLSGEELRNFVNDYLNIDIPERSYKAISNMLYNSSFSYTKDYLTQIYNDISPELEGFLDELTDELKNAYTTASIDFAIDKIHLKWTRKVKTQEDREAITATINVAKSSKEYWNKNISKWGVPNIIKQSTFRTIIGHAVAADCICIIDFIRIGRQWVIPFWDKIAVAAAGTSVVYGIVGALEDRIISTSGEYIIFSNGETITYSELKKMRYNACAKAINNMQF